MGGLGHSIVCGTKIKSFLMRCDMISKRTKISVIVPVYNENREYLDDCISSICNQTYEDLEIILVDDGSDVICYEACDEYKKIDKRIKVFHKENEGTQSSRRKGIEEATGDYVAFVDSDDWVEPELYKKMTEIINMHKPEMLVASNYYRNYSNGTVLNATNNNRTGFWSNSEFEQEVFPYFIKTEGYFDTELPAAMWAYLFKTNFARIIIKEVGDNIKTAEDYAFLMIAFLNAKSLSAISYRGYHYRSNINSKTHTIKNIKELLRPVYEIVDNAITQSAYDQESLKKKNRIFIFHSLMLRDYKCLLGHQNSFLFPYSQIARGSKVLIYGAGKLGKEMYGAIKNSTDFEIIGIADKNWKSYEEQGLDVISPEDILKRQFDYIIIAVTYVNVRRQIKSALIKAGVMENKIAEIDMDVFDEAHLPF